jgi:hypothetical protein
MGREIVYCENCGKRLTTQDFEKRKAHTEGHRHFCVACKPLPPPPPERTPRSGSRRPSGSRNPLATPRTPSRTVAALPQDRGRSNPLPWYLAGGGIALVLAAFIAFSSGGGAPPAPPPRPPSPPKADPGAAAIADLERFLATKPAPEAVLARADAVRSTVRGTPHEERLSRIEERAREELKLRLPAVEDRLTPFLKEIRRLIDADRELRRKNDVLSMLETAARMAGERGGEVAVLKADYERLLQAGAAPADLMLLPDAARLQGQTIYIARSGDASAVAGFNALDCTAEWAAEVPKAGLWDVEFTLAVGAGSGGEYAFSCGPEVLRGPTVDTGGWDRYEVRPVGRIRLPSGAVTLALRPTANKGGLMNLRQIRLSWAGD